MQQRTVRWCGAFVGALVASAALLVPCSGCAEAEAGPEEIVFDLNYRGLSGGDDDIRCRHHYGSGPPQGDPTAFYRAVEEAAENLHSVRAPWKMQTLGWVAFEMQGAEPVAAYLDMNRDGALDPEERIGPSDYHEMQKRFSFTTPDFEAVTDDGLVVPYRLQLQVGTWNPDHPQAMWGSLCVWEGEAKVGRKAWSLLLLDGGMDGRFSEFGTDRVVLVPSREMKRKGHLPQDPLSSLVPMGDDYYSVRFEGEADQETFRALLSPYRGETGRIRAAFAGAKEVKVELSDLRIQGVSDPTVHFSLPAKTKETVLPTGRYKIQSGFLSFGTERAMGSHTRFSDGGEVVVTAGETCDLNLGKLRVEVKARDENKRYQRDAKGQTTFKKGTTVHIAQETRGIAGELYGRIYSASDRTNTGPQVRILNAKGKQVESGNMEYG